MFDFYDIEKLKKPINNVPVADRIATNAGYAHMYHLKHYAGVSEDTIMNCVIEHGFYTMNGAYIYEIMQNVPAILTFSKFRKRILEEKYNIEAIPIGPYIEYVDGMGTMDEVSEIRKRNGRTLLVMPAHYSREESKIYDFKELFSEIDRVAKNFDKVIVSLPIFDLQRNVHKIFLEKGYDVVSVGGGGDCSYLRRLKTIIECSDAIMANAFTTGLVYSVYLNKPVYLFNQKVDLRKVVKVLYRTEETEIVEKFEEISSDDSFMNLEQQKKWGYVYAGFDCVKCRDELRQILIANSRGM